MRIVSRAKAWMFVGLVTVVILLGFTSSTAAAPSASVSGTVFNDRNFSASQGSGEEVLRGVALELYRLRVVTPGQFEWVLVATDTTDSRGRYGFGGLGADQQFRIRLAEVQPVHIDALGFNGLGIVTGNTSFSVNEQGQLEKSGRPFPSSGVAIGVHRFHRVDIETWVDLDQDGVNDPEESAPSELRVGFLDNTGAWVDSPHRYHTTHKKFHIQINERDTAYAIRVQSNPSFRTGQIAVFDTDGGVAGDIVIRPTAGRNWPSYQVIFGKEDDFGGVVDNCATTTPQGWAIDQVANDGVSAQVWRLYSAMFIRQPDRQGFDYWRQIRSGGQSHVVVAEAFAASVEFNNRYGSVSDGQYVRLLYRNILCREPDLAGYRYWVQSIRNGLSRGQAMLYFSEGSEYLQRTNTNHPIV